MYISEKDGPFYRSLNYLRFMGQIPVFIDKSHTRKFFTIFLLSKAVSFFCTAIGPVLHLTVSVMNHSGLDITEDISITFGATGGGVVCLLFTLKYEKWSNFFKDLVDTRLFGKPATFDKTASRLNHFGNISFFCFSWVTIIYAVAAWYSSKGCEPTDESFRDICPAFVPIWLPFGANDIVAGTVVFILQIFFVGILIAQPFLTQCYIMYESTEMLLCQIDDLNYHFKIAFDTTSIQETRNRLRFCIDYHIHILKLGYRLSSLIKYTAGHMSLLSALVCGLVANQILHTKPMGSFIFLAAWLFALLCFCHAGQRVKDQTLSVADALWNAQWYKLDARTIRDVQFILLRCQKPVYFEALPMGVTDYAFYFMMIRTGYSYFALFHQSL